MWKPQQEILSYKLGYRGFNDYMSSEHWQSMIKTYLGNKCVKCNSVKNLVLHHKTFVRLGCEKPHDLITLCFGCSQRARLRLSGWK